MNKSKEGGFFAILIILMAYFIAIDIAYGICIGEPLSINCMTSIRVATCKTVVAIFSR